MVPESAQVWDWKKKNSTNTEISTLLCINLPSIISLSSHWPLAADFHFMMSSKPNNFIRQSSKVTGTKWETYRYGGFAGIFPVLQQ